MSARSRTEHAHPAEATPGRRFNRAFRGYRRTAVDDAMARLELRISDLEHEAVELREALLDTQHEASETKHDLTRSRAELRYWNDRASYVDTEVARARQRANEVEQAARERAETIEADAQERSLQLIDRVCAEANAMLQHAREEAREMFLRFETDVDMSQQKLDKLETVRGEVARTMQSALLQFEDAVRELDKVGPARRIVEQLETPQRRSVPTFGKERAMEAARRFETTAADSASSAMSSPLPAVLTATVEQVQDTSKPEALTAPTQAPSPTPTPTSTVTPARSSEPVTPTEPSADDEFISLIMQP